MKPAEPSSVTGALLMEMFEEAGVPPGVLNYLPGHGSVIGQHLVDHPEVVMIAFTGSRSRTSHLGISSRHCPASAN
jgi:RHH-type proline utilization regulon transcriptional repressor/proline dehydrogenase/delta 1-pyrroline-5-carboxylate dehydrogenase